MDLPENPPDPRKDPPFQSEINRTLWIGLGANGLLSLACQLIFGGLFFGYLFLFGSIAMVVRGWRPAWFSKHHEAQLISQIPYRRTESGKSWGVVLHASQAGEEKTAGKAEAGQAKSLVLAYRVPGV